LRGWSANTNAYFEALIGISIYLFR
jgi:hypothetical protein